MDFWSLAVADAYRAANSGNIVNATVIFFAEQGAWIAAEGRVTARAAHLPNELPSLILEGVLEHPIPTNPGHFTGPITLTIEAPTGLTQDAFVQVTLTLGGQETTMTLRQGIDAYALRSFAESTSGMVVADAKGGTNNSVTIRLWWAPYLLPTAGWLETVLGKQ
jgi:hypothetical protein